MLSQTGGVKLQDAAAATGNGTALSMAGRTSTVFQISGTFSGTITFEGSMDGTNWIGVACANLNSTTRARALTATAAGLFQFQSVKGLLKFRARISAYSSGTITVIANASD